jgi:YesN/AraC family two-component response regulator
MNCTARAIIAEDEDVLRTGLRNALAELWPDLRICALVEDGIQAMRALDEHDPDILFLDIEMPGLTGLEVAKQVNAAMSCS